MECGVLWSRNVNTEEDGPIAMGKTGRNIVAGKTENQRDLQLG